MKSFFAKNYFAYSALILAIFFITGVVFTFFINRFSMAEKQEQLQTTVTLASDLTVFLYENYTYTVDRLYQISIEQLASDGEVSIIVADSAGKIILTASGEEAPIQMDNIRDGILNSTMDEGGYIEVGTFGDVFYEPNYILGLPVYSSTSEGVIAYVYVATSATDAAGLLYDVMQSFFIIIFFALIIVLIMSYFITSRMTKPLKVMASASKRFAHGDFSARVSENNNCEEIDELAISFNNMAYSLEQLEELSRGFVANVSHELKTPMTSIGGFIDGILDGTIPPEKQSHYLQIISEEIKRLSRLVIRMLDAAKLQSGEITLNPVSFDLCEMAMRIILSFENQISRRKINVNLDFCDRMIIMGDEDHLFRVFYNLVDNAVKFVNDNGELNVKISKEYNFAHVNISNTGVNIAENDLPHVFDRFYKADRSRSYDKTGAGLGLYIVKSIINLHGGDISVTSNSEITTFSFDLPIKN